MHGQYGAWVIFMQLPWQCVDMRGQRFRGIADCKAVSCLKDAFIEQSDSRNYPLVRISNRTVRAKAAEISLTMVSSVLYIYAGDNMHNAHQDSKYILISKCKVD